MPVAADRLSWYSLHELCIKITAWSALMSVCLLGRPWSQASYLLLQVACSQQRASDFLRLVPRNELLTNLSHFRS